MLDGNTLGTLAASKEWGLILVLIIVFVLMIKAFMRSLAERDKMAGEREDQMTRVLVDTVSKLSNSIDALKSWLEREFSSVGEGIEEIKGTQEEISVAVKDHENRIGTLEQSQKKDVSDETRTKRRRSPSA